MYTVIAPIPGDLANAIQPYRQKYDVGFSLMPPHISLLEPFQLTGPSDKLYDHLSEIGETHAPIKVSLVGWDIHPTERTYELRLPVIAGKPEFTALRNHLLTGLLQPLASSTEDYWPHINFGQLSSEAEMQRAKKQLKFFEPQYIFRVTYLELWQTTDQSQAWQLQEKFSLEATMASRRRRSNSSNSPLRLNL
jgi:hypothetical protein